MAFYQALPWHAGEDKIHEMTRVPSMDNPTHPMLSHFAANRIAVSPTIALGTVDNEDRVWCTLWGGDVPIAQLVAPGGVIGIRTQVDASFDPVVQALYGGKDGGEIVRHDPTKGKMVSGLSIKLEDRDRVKLFGKMMAGSLSADEAPEELAEQTVTDSKHQNIGKTGHAQLVVQITQSLGNCPKYLNKKRIQPYPNAKPRLTCDKPLLTEAAVKHVHSADMFFIASRGPEDMDCNHRGGPPGFIRVQQPTEPSQPQRSVIVWPEYSGNNLYQTLGNIIYDPKIGIVIPDFTTGNVLYLSGHAEVLLNQAATTVIQKTKLAVRFTVSSARFVHDGLTFRGIPCADNSDISSSRPITKRPITDGQSPYNPRIRYLTSEVSSLLSTDSSDPALPPDEYRISSDPDLIATLLQKTKLTPTITKYRFSLTSRTHHNLPPSSLLWKPGQYIALDFSDELYMGYTHMNDSDPTSLNDDFLRTFTISSIYKPAKAGSDVNFEITVRNVGVVTGWLSHQNDRSGTTRIGVRGFGGDFRFETRALGQGKKKNVFIAAGIGITPLLGQMGGAEEENPSDGLIVLWAINIVDVGLALHVIKTAPNGLKKNLRLFVTGTGNEAEGSKNLKILAEVEKEAVGGLQIERRRLVKDDLTALEESGDVEIDNWYLCTAPAMRKQVQEWLGGRTIVFENFDY